MQRLWHRGRTEAVAGRRSLRAIVLTFAVTATLTAAASTATTATAASTRDRSTATTAADRMDVYLLAGQSNMQGLAKLADAPDAELVPNPNATMWFGTSAFEPLVPGTTRTSANADEFGPEVGFARELGSGQPDQHIAVIKFARNGQALHEGWDDQTWLGGAGPNRATFFPGYVPDGVNIGRHYLDMRAQIRAALASLAQQNIPYTIKGIIWVQGEQDSKNCTSATQYAARLALLKNRLEQDVIGHSVPLVYSQALPYTPAADRFVCRDELRQAQADADWRSGSAQSIPNAWMVSTDNLTVQSDTVHYDATGQIALGHALAKTVTAANASAAKRSHQPRR